MAIINSIGPQAGASSIVGGDTLPSSPTFRQVFVTSSGMYVALSDGTWSLLDSADAGTVSGSGVTNRLTKWIDGTGSVLGDSGVADDGTNVLSLRPFAVGYGLSTPAGLLAGPKITAASTISTSPRGILSAQYSTDTAGARVGFQKARGTIGTPTTIVTGDTLGRLMFRGYDGTSYLEMGSIEVGSTGTIGTNRVPTQIVFSTATDASTSVLTTALTLKTDQTAVFAQPVTMSVGATTSALTDLLVNPTTKASGNLFQAAVNSVNKFSVDFAGAGTFAGAVAATNFNASANVQAGDTNAFYFATRSQVRSPANGTISLQTAANTGFGSLVLGATAPSTIGAVPSHGQTFTIIQGEELLTIGAGATTTTTMQIPANAVVYGVSARVVTVIPVAVSFTVTVGGTVCSTTAISTAANTTDPGTFSGAFYNSTTQSITITPNAPPLAATGQVRLTAIYAVVTPATS